MQLPRMPHSFAWFPACNPAPNKTKQSGSSLEASSIFGLPGLRKVSGIEAIQPGVEALKCAACHLRVHCSGCGTGANTPCRFQTVQGSGPKLLARQADRAFGIPCRTRMAFPCRRQAPRFLTFVNVFAPALPYPQPCHFRPAKTGSDNSCPRKQPLQSIKITREDQHRQWAPNSTKADIVISALLGNDLSRGPYQRLPSNNS